MWKTFLIFQHPYADSTGILMMMKFYISSQMPTVIEFSPFHHSYRNENIKKRRKTKQMTDGYWRFVVSINNDKKTHYHYWTFTDIFSHYVCLFGLIKNIICVGVWMDEWMDDVSNANDKYPLHWNSDNSNHVFFVIFQIYLFISVATIILISKLWIYEKKLFSLFQQQEWMKKINYSIQE